MENIMKKKYEITKDTVQSNGITLHRIKALHKIEPDEVTAQSVADYTGCSWSKASAVLKAKLASGEVTARKVRTRNGKPATAYRKAAL